MGCDIHAYVEFGRPDESGHVKYWRGLTRNFGSRDYAFFGIIAGVRAPEYALFEQSGFDRENLGYDAQRDYWRNVAPDAFPDWAGSENWVSREDAERWVAAGSSSPRYRDGALVAVTDPDAHTPGELTADQLEEALKRYSEVMAESDWQGTGVEWGAVLAAMRHFEANGLRARVIFWFDN